VRLEQTVEVRLAVRDLTRKGFTTPFEIVRQEDGVLAAYGAITRRVVDVRQFRGVEAPDALYAKFEEMRDESAAMTFPHVGAASAGA
jgi:acyl-CoA thioesterase FadM